MTDREVPIIKPFCPEIVSLAALRELNRYGATNMNIDPAIPDPEETDDVELNMDDDLEIEDEDEDEENEIEFDSDHDDEETGL